MAEPVSIVVSAAALVVSVVTAWLTLFRRGTVRMTQPTVIFFGWDVSTAGRPASQKVFLRTLLYSTARRGHIIQSMYVTLRRGESRQTFNIWVYGDETLARGSGIFAGESGIVCNHHFLLPEDSSSFSFLAGDYKLEVYASLVGTTQPLDLYTVTLTVSQDAAKELQEKECGLYFDWGPDSQRYYPHIERRKLLKASTYDVDAFS